LAATALVSGMLKGAYRHGALVIGKGHAEEVKELKPNSISQSGAQMLKRVQELLSRSDSVVFLVE
jgi:hypothetical protein